MIESKLDGLGEGFVRLDSAHKEVLAGSAEVLFDAIKKSDKESLIQLLGIISNRGVTADELLSALIRTMSEDSE